MFAMLALGFYFFIARPANKERAERKKLLDSLAKGDTVITAGGIHGKVVDFGQGGEIVTIECGPKVHIDFTRTAVTTIVKRKNESAGGSGSGASASGSEKSGAASAASPASGSGSEKDAKKEKK